MPVGESPVVEILVSSSFSFVVEGLVVEGAVGVLGVGVETKELKNNVFTQTLFFPS